jgi:tetratricopeptide (TPR) repeat protein
MRSTAKLALTLTLLLLPGTLLAQSWYDHYEEGLKAARNGEWTVVLDKMNKAIAGNAKEAARARTYGTLFINYRPYYYRAVANLNLGRYQEAVSDLEKTTGPGPDNLGSIGELMQQAKSRLAQGQTVTPTPVPVPVPQPTGTQTVIPTPQPQPQPALPVIDPALQSRADSAVEQVEARLRAAQERNAADTAAYREALQQFRDLTARVARAKTNDELRAVIGEARAAALTADSAVAPALTTTKAPTKTATATTVVLADSSRRVRAALESYFRGDFDEAAAAFSRLSQELPTNGWIWAFLGASQYSQYAFEADEQYRRDALEAFKKARTYGRWGREGLPSKYFSRRIRRAFNETAG